MLAYGEGQVAGAEDIGLKGYATAGELGQGVRRWFERYNIWRPHQNLGNKTPADVYGTKRKPTTPGT